MERSPKGGEVGNAQGGPKVSPVGRQRARHLGLQAGGGEGEGAQISALFGAAG